MCWLGGVACSRFLLQSLKKRTLLGDAHNKGPQAQIPVLYVVTPQAFEVLPQASFVLTVTPQAFEVLPQASFVKEKRAPPR